MEGSWNPRFIAQIDLALMSVLAGSVEVTVGYLGPMADHQLINYPLVI